MTDESTVLVVDDERAITDLHARWLMRDYEVRRAYSGQEALETVDESVDIVLLDRRMPDRSGRTVLAEIRDRDLDCRVAMVTAVEPDFDILELGFDAYVNKPVSAPGELRDIVASLDVRSTYDSRVQEFLSLAAKKATLETRKAPHELANSDEYADLGAKLSSLRTHLDDVAADLDDDDLRAEFHARNTTGSNLVDAGPDAADGEE